MPGYWYPLYAYVRRRGYATLDGSTIFRVTSSGAPPFSWQWRFNGSDIAGATNATLMLQNFQSNAFGAYRVEVRNPFGTNLSEIAELRPGTPPSFTTLPRSQTVLAGESVTFSVDVNGTMPIHFLWRKGSSLFIPFAQGGPSMTITKRATR